MLFTKIDPEEKKTTCRYGTYIILSSSLVSFEEEEEEEFNGTIRRREVIISNKSFFLIIEDTHTYTRALFPSFLLVAHHEYSLENIGKKVTCTIERFRCKRWPRPGSTAG